MKKILNEYDDTKRMLNAIRKFSLLNEQYAGEANPQNKVDTELDDSGKTESDVDNINDVDVHLISNDDSDLSLNDQQRQGVGNLIDSFRDQVSQTANLEPGLTFTTGQVRLDGVLPDYDIKFVYISGQNAGLYINAQMLKITDQIIPVIQKLYKFQNQFNTFMDTLIRERENN